MKSFPHPWNSKNNEKSMYTTTISKKKSQKSTSFQFGEWGGARWFFFFFFLSPGAGWIHDLPYVRENPNKPLNNIIPKSMREISRRIFQKWLESKDASKDLLFGIILTINLLTQTCFHFLHVKKHQVLPKQNMKKREDC